MSSIPTKPMTDIKPNTDFSPQSAMEAARATRNPLKKLYFWTIHWAATKHAVPALFLIALMESSFFPIPPDVLLIAMCFARPKKGWGYAFWCSVASVLGGVLGWVIGWGFYETVGVRIIEAFHYQEHFQTVEKLYQENAFAAILLAAFTPIPYKVFTIAAGVFHIPIPILVAASVIGRSGRFFLVAGFIYFFGPRVKPFLEKYFEWFTLAFGALLIGGFVLVKYLL
jgi:membrane protein YqaA with SNARE-associated domain